MNTEQRRGRRDDEADLQESRADREKRRRKDRGGGELTGQRLGVAKSKLDFDKFAYRWINDDPGRIFAKTKEDDWDIVTNDGGVIKEDSPDLGSAVSQIVGTKPDGSARVAYLCRKPKTYFDEDQAAKAQALDQQLADLRRGKTSEGEAEYVPSSGISGVR